MSTTSIKLFGFDEKTTIAMISVMILVTTVVIVLGTRYILKKSQNSQVNDRKVLKSIYDQNNGPNWDIKYSENWCKDDCKLGEWAGIEAGFANGHEHVLELIMRGNRNFTGI